MKIDIDEFNGIYTNADSHKIPPQFFKRAENIVIEDGYCETKGISLTSLSGTVPTPTTDFEIAAIFPCNLRSDNLSEIVTYGTVPCVIYIFTLIQDETDVVLFPSEESISYEFWLSVDNVAATQLTSLSASALKFNYPGVPSAIEPYERNGIAEIYTDHASFVVEYMDRELGSYRAYSDTLNGAVIGAEKITETFTGYYLDFLVKIPDNVVVNNFLDNAKYYSNSENNFSMGFDASILNDYQNNNNPYKANSLTSNYALVEQQPSVRYGGSEVGITYTITPYKVTLQKNGVNYLTIVIGFNTTVFNPLGNNYTFTRPSGWISIQAWSNGVDITDYITSGSYNTPWGTPVTIVDGTGGIGLDLPHYDWWTATDNNAANHMISNVMFEEGETKWLFDRDNFPINDYFPIGAGPARQLGFILWTLSLYAGTLIKDLHDDGFSIAADLNPKVLVAYNLSNRNVVFDNTPVKLTATNGTDDKYLIDFTVNIPKSFSPQITEILVFVKTDLLVNTEFQQGEDYVLAKTIKRLAFEEEDIDYTTSGYTQYHDLISKTDLTGITLQQMAGVYFDEKRPALSVPILVQKNHTLVNDFGFMLSRGTLYYSAIGYGVIQRNMFYPVTVLNINENAIALTKVGNDLGVFLADGLKIIHIENIGSTPVFSEKTKLPHIKKSNIVLVGDAVLFASTFGLMLLDGYEANNIGKPIADKISAATTIQVEYNDYYKMIYLVLDTTLYQFSIEYKAWTQMTVPNFVKFYPGTKPIVLTNDNDVYALSTVDYVITRGLIEFNDIIFNDIANYKKFYSIIFDKESGPAYSGLPALPEDPDDVDPKVTYEADADKFCVTANNNIPQGGTYGWILETNEFNASFKITQSLSKILSIKIEGIFKLKALKILFDIILVEE